MVELMVTVKTVIGVVLVLLEGVKGVLLMLIGGVRGDEFRLLWW